MDAASKSSLYLEFEGPRGQRRPVRARRRQMQSGVRTRVYVEREALEQGNVYLLFRSGHGDMVLGASARRHVLEAARARLGASREAYEIIAVPVEGSPEPEAA